MLGAGEMNIEQIDLSGGSQSPRVVGETGMDLAEAALPNHCNDSSGILEVRG
jgi:hypothetical protein